MKRFAIGLVCSLLMATALPYASADILIDAGPNSTSQTFSTGNYVAGSEFTINAPIRIDSLGWLDAEGNGLTATHQIGLWEVVSQVLLATATVDNNSPTHASAHGTAQWFMGSIGSPITLAPGTYRVAGEVSGDNIALSNDKIGNFGATISAGYVRTDFPNGGFNFPNLTFGSEAIRATVGVLAIPEPSGFGLIALAGYVVLFRRKKT